MKNRWSSVKWMKNKHRTSLNRNIREIENTNSFISYKNENCNKSKHSQWNGENILMYYLGNLYSLFEIFKKLFKTESDFKEVDEFIYEKQTKLLILKFIEKIKIAICIVLSITVLCVFLHIIFPLQLGDASSVVLTWIAIFTIVFSIWVALLWFNPKFISFAIPILILVMILLQVKLSIVSRELSFFSWYFYPNNTIKCFPVNKFY